MVDVEEAARLTGLSPGYLRRLARDGGVEATREGRRWLISAGSVAALRSPPTDAGAETWDLERRLLYAERADLQTKLLQQRVEQLESDNDRLEAENTRLREALVAVVARPVAPPARAR